MRIVEPLRLRTLWMHKIRLGDCQSCLKAEAHLLLILSEIKLLRLDWIWITLNGLKTFQQYITTTHHTIMSSAGIETPHRCLPFERLKIIWVLLLPPTKPHHSCSPHQPQSRQITLRRAATFHTFWLLSRHPIPDYTASVLSLVLRAGGRCMMGVVGKAERQRERRVHEDEAAASHDFTAWVLFPCLQG